MSRYIDADMLIKLKCIEKCGEVADYCQCKCFELDDIRNAPTAEVKPIVELKEEFEREIEIANKDIDLMPEQEDYMRGYLGGILCAYRIVFGKNYEEKTE